MAYRCPVCQQLNESGSVRCCKCNTPRDGNSILKMDPEVVPFGFWVKRDRAQFIIEGATVIVRTKLAKPSYDKWYDYHVYKWFRTDGIDKNAFGKGDEEYLLLENTIH